MSAAKFVDQHGAVHTVRCSECRKVCRGTTGWNSVLKSGSLVGFLCPTCQTPEQNAEAEVNQATLEYGRDHLGRVTGRMKA